MRMLAMCIAATALTLPVAAGFATSHDAPPTITEWFALTAPVEEVDAAPEGLPSTRTRIDASDVAVAPDYAEEVGDEHRYRCRRA